MTRPYSIGEEDVRAFSEHLRLEVQVRPATSVIYTRELQWLCNYAAGSPVTEELVRAWNMSRGGSASTMDRRLSAVKGYCGFRDIPDLTRKIRRPKRPKGLPRPIEDPEGFAKRLPSLMRHVLRFLLDTGLRIAEACAENGDGFEDHHDELLVTGKGQKERLVPMTRRARWSLTALGGRVPFSVRQVQAAFRLASKGWPQRVTPHMARHTYACRLLEAGADLGEVQELLGHESPATTKRYGAYSKARKRRAVDRLEQE